MRTTLVVFASPSLHDLLRLCQRREPMGIQAFCPKRPVEIQPVAICPKSLTVAVVDGKDYPATGNTCTELRTKTKKEKGHFCEWPFSLVCRACSTAWRCKSSSQPDGGEVIAKRKGEITLAARRGLKEARRKRRDKPAWRCVQGRLAYSVRKSLTRAKARAL